MVKNMLKIFYMHRYENNFIQASIECPDGSKEWEGSYVIDEEPTDTKIQAIIKEFPIQINRFFPRHEGIAHFFSIIKKRPMVISFRGTGPLIEDGKVVEC